MANQEKYEFEIGEEGLDYDILDISYNEHTQQFLLKNGLKQGMHILDVGCGAGVMTAWLAHQVGENGQVLAIDNSPEQLKVTENKIKQLGLTNVKTQVLSAYDIEKLNIKFDAVYCRFLLHHLHSPRLVIHQFYQVLNSNGCYFGQEGVVSAAFAYPDTFAWQGYKPNLIAPENEIEGDGRDGNFGMKLFYNCLKAGFDMLDCVYHQPLLWKKAQKERLLSGLIAFKQTELDNGMSEEEWQRNYDETLRFIHDDNQLIAFYGSCLVACRKP
jgi:SAM-dependent methyltransferase